MSRLSYERLLKILNYDPETGIWTWKVRTANRTQIGAVAGSLDEKGYWRLQIGPRKYRAHRLAWFYMTGEWPTRFVDHRDTNRANNRWENLRQATMSENLCNSGKKRTNKCGFKGVHLRKKGGFLASIQKDGKKIHIGIYETPEEAHAAYQARAAELHGDFVRTEAA